MTDPYPSRGDRRRISPRLDPVVHGVWTPGAPITEAETRQFDRDGYLSLHGRFSAEEVAALQQGMAALLGDPAVLAPETVITEPLGDAVRSIFMIHRQSALIARLAADPRLVDIARFLLDDAVYIHQSRLNYKPGFQGKEFYWHSDFETWHVEDGMPRMRALSMSVLLTPNTAINGPLMLIPGSHRSYLGCAGAAPENHYRQSLKKQEYGVPDQDDLATLVADHGIVAPLGEPGTVLIFDCNIMHGSNGNITPQPRANAFFVYNAVSNRLVAPFGPKTPRPEFLAARDHAQPLRRPKTGLLEAAA